tara:strand:+ start:779 stop:1183 length:405 start_codon:yes stop_codon:yes gene_type:complete
MKISIRILLILLCISFTQHANAGSFGALKNLFKGGHSAGKTPGAIGDKDNNQKNVFEEETTWLIYKDEPCPKDMDSEDNANRIQKTKYCLALREQCLDIFYSYKRHECINNVREGLGYEPKKSFSDSRFGSGAE